MVQEFEPVRVVSGGGDDVKRVPLFIVQHKDGTETVYDVPEEVPPQITMRSLRDLADGMQHETVIARAMRDVVGQEAMDELADNPDFTKEQVSAVMGVLERMVLAAQEDTVGKRRPVPRR
jgi:hypothetical protein